MGVSISQNKQFLSIGFYKIDYDKIFLLLSLLKIEQLSVFTDEKNSYCFNDNISINEFTEYVVKSKKSLLIFDGYVKECFIDKEIEVLLNRKILIEIDLGENYMFILINKGSANISIKDIKQRMSITSGF